MTNSTSAPRNNSAVSDDELDVVQLLGTLLDHKWIIICITAAFAVVGVLYALLATPVYQADALMQVESKSSGMALLGDMEDLFDSSSPAQAEIEIAKSRMVVREVVEQLQADVSVKPQARSLKESYFPGLLANSNKMPFAAWVDDEITLRIEELSIPSWLIGEELTLEVVSNNEYKLFHEGEELISGEVGEPTTNEDIALTVEVKEIEAPQGFTFSVQKTSLAKAIKRIQSNLQISEVGKQSGILKFVYTGTNSEAILQTLNGVTTSYFLQNIKRRAEEAEKSLDFLQEQLPEVREELDDAEQDLSKFRLENESVDLTLETQSILERLVEVDARLNELSFKETEAAALFTEEHPTVKTLAKQRDTLEKEKERLKNDTKKLPKTQQEMLKLSRDVELNQQIYLQLQNRDQELRIVKAGTVGNVRIIDDAQMQTGLVKPKRKLIVLISILLGGMLSVGLVLAKTMLRRGIESQEDLEQAGIAVYATVPLSEEQRKQEAQYDRRRKRKGEANKTIPLLAESSPADLSVESLRSLRTSLYFAMMDAPNKVLSLSGPSPQIGKSFVASNLAAVLAQAGQRVLLIDGDLRKGRLHRYFGDNNKVGLSGYLAGKYELNEVISQCEIENLDVITRGEVPPNPSELLMQPRLQELVDIASEQYDMIIIDTPPVLAVTDAAIVGRVAGTNLVVARYDLTTVKEVENTLDRFAKNDIEIKGTILNAIERTATNYYYYYEYSYQSDKD